MSFLIQWLVYLAAFVAGSAVAYGIVSLLIKTRTAPAPAEIAPQPVSHPASELEPVAAAEPGPEVDAPPPRWPEFEAASTEQEPQTFEQLLWPATAQPVTEVSEPDEPEPDPVGPEPQSPEPEELEAEPDEPDREEPEPDEPQPEEQEPAAETEEPQPEPEPEGQPEPDLPQPQWPAPPSAWPGIGVKR
ncbi:channel accessory protein ArfB [Mycobacterium sp. ML4]